MQEGFSGSLRWVQLVDEHHRRKSNDGVTWQKLQGSGLDTAYPYQDGATTSDSPLTTMSSDFMEWRCNHSFQMWLLFQPSAGGIYVPLRKVTWSWTGTAIRNGSTWNLTSSTAIANTSEDTTEFAEWIRNVVQNTWVNE